MCLFDWFHPIRKIYNPYIYQPKIAGKLKLTVSLPFPEVYNSFSQHVISNLSDPCSIQCKSQISVHFL